MPVPSPRPTAGALCRLCGARPRQVFPSGTSTYCRPCRTKREAETRAARSAHVKAPPATPAPLDTDASEAPTPAPAPASVELATRAQLDALDVDPGAHTGAQGERLDASEGAQLGAQGERLDASEGAQLGAQGEDRERQVYRMLTDSMLLLDRARVLAESGAVNSLQITADLSSGSVLELKVRGKASDT